MKALSLWQPWASLVAFGEKRFETRSWSTQHRGLLAIHAAKRLEKDQAFLLAREPFRSVLHRNNIVLPSQLVRGAIIAICWLVDCMPTSQARRYIFSQELAFGDYSAGRWAWLLRSAVVLPEPIICPGHQGLWNWSERIVGPNPNMVQDAIEKILAENGELRPR